MSCVQPVRSTCPRDGESRSAGKSAAILSLDLRTTNTPNLNLPVKSTPNAMSSRMKIEGPPARAQAAEALQLERQLNDLVNQAYGLSPDEVALLWQTAPPRMPFSPEN